jgi:hypothetical protein
MNKARDFEFYEHLGYSYLRESCQFGPAKAAAWVIRRHVSSHWLGYLILTAFVALIWFVLAGLMAADEREAREKAEFMVECQEAQPKYECTAMWRAGERRSRGGGTTVVPVYAPVYRAR